MKPEVGTFGDLLREYRARAGLSQEELAEKARLSAAAVGALERGIRRAPYRSTVVLLANALDLGPKESAALEAARRRRPGESSRKHPSHNVPSNRTSLVGRDADVQHIHKLLRRSRLVTVSGSGGVGKTRAALEAARRTLGDIWSEMWFVDLSPLRDGDILSAKIASTIEPPISDHAESMPGLASALASREMLLILDNCEHVIAEAARAADLILENCPDITVLATSREPLNVAGEFVYRLPSLASEPATELFTQRAEAADPRILFDAETLRLVAAIVSRLGGIPLAIELAAAHVPVFGIQALQTRLSEELRIPSERRDLPVRQRTVIATIQWSYDLLAEAERALLCDASIFAGSFSLEAAEAVCLRGGPDSTSLLPALSSLANKSLLNVEGGAGGRYSLLESVRSFALESLNEKGHFSELARRHAQWLAARADHVERTTTYLSAERAAELLLDFDNVRSAIAWSLGSSNQDDRVLAARILTGLDGLWDHVGLRREHRRLVENALQLIDEARFPLAYSYLLASSAARSPTQTGVLGLIDRAVGLCERSGDDLALAKLLVIVAQIKAWHGMIDDAERFMERALPLLEAGKKLHSMMYATFLFARSELRLREGRIDEARADVAAAETMALELGERYYVACFVYVRRCEIEYAGGNVRLALEFAERMLASGIVSDPQIAGFALGRISNLRLLVGDVEGAVGPLLEHLSDMRGNDGFTFGELECAALALAMRRQPVVAAKLLGRIRSEERRAPFRRGKARQDAYDRLISLLQKQLSDEAFDRAMSTGTLLSKDQATDEALTALTTLQPSAPA